MSEPTADQLHAMAKAARAAGLHLQATTTQQRNDVLSTLGGNLRASLDSIRAANQIDLDTAKVAVERGDLSSATFKRLDVLGPEGGKLDALVQGVHDVVGLEDPLNQITLARELDTNLNLYRVTCPIGVLLIIFEARPEVVIQISSLAIKSGNAVILKGGKEATHTLRALHLLVQSALAEHNLPAECVQLIEGRAAVSGLLALDKYIDLVIPRGSASLVRYIKDNTRIPVMGHADGICSVYLDKDVPTEFDVAQVIVDAKAQYPAACNAAETLLVHQDIVQSDTFKHVVGELIKAGVQLKCDPDTLAVASVVASSHANGPIPVASVPEDYDTEFLDLTLAVKSIPSLPRAMEHIRDHGSGHTDVILTSNVQAANAFMRGVDSAGVYWNASSRFADGFRYSFGCEVGVSTNRIHARGPVGLEGLVCYKYRMHGNGQRVGQYGGAGGKGYTHRKIEAAEEIKKMVRGEQ